MNTISPNIRRDKKKIPEVERFLLLLNTIDIQPIDLSKKISIPVRTINNVIYENKPIGWQLMRKLNTVLGVSIDWLLGGHGSMFVSNTPINESNGAYVAIDPRVFRITSFINDFFESASDDEKAWLEMQLKFTLPPYRAFLERVKDE